MIALSTQDISLSFGTDEILKNISFSVNEGDRVGIIGVNGAGKTSLFRVITGKYSTPKMKEAVSNAILRQPLLGIVRFRREALFLKA